MPLISQSSQVIKTTIKMLTTRRIFEIKTEAKPEYIWWFEEELYYCAFGTIPWFSPRLDYRQLEESLALVGYREILNKLLRIPRSDISAFVAAAYLAEDGLAAGAVHHALGDLGLSVCPDWQPRGHRPGQALPPGPRVTQKFGPQQKVGYVQRIGTRMRGCIWSSRDGRPRHLHFRELF